MRKQKGITLVALVITIIVLLILAGVSISMISGDDGIATRASEAKQQTEEKGKEELEALGGVPDYIDQQVNKGGVEQEPEVETITIIFDNGNSSYKFFALTKDNSKVYAEELDSYQFAVPAGSKVERPFRGTYMHYEFDDFPMEFYEYELYLNGNYINNSLTLDKIPTINESPLIVAVYEPNIDVYRTTSGTAIDIDNFYPTENMTVICYDDP